MGGRHAGPLEPLEKIFIANVIKERDRHRYTHRDIEALTGVSHSHLQQILSGQRGISFRTFCKICHGLGVLPEAMLEDWGDN